MNRNHILKLGLIVCFCTIIFSGCGGINKTVYNLSPYKVNVERTDINNIGKQKVLDHIIKRKYGIGKYGRTQDGYHLLNSCISENQIIENTRYLYKNCFTVKDNLIILLDKSKCFSRKSGSREREIECSYVGDKAKKYLDFINQVDISKEYNKKVKHYKEFSDSYDKFKEEAKNKIKNVKIVEKNKILSSKILKELNSDGISMIEKKPKESQYENGIYKYHLIKENLIVNSKSIPEVFNRYKFKYSKYSSKYSYSVFSIGDTLNIEKISFNYIPEVFIVSDSTVKLIVRKDLLGSFNIEVMNLSNKFISLSNISIYYNGKIRTIPLSINLPPQSKTLENDIKITLPNNQNEYVLVKNKKQSINYGYALEYIKNGKKANLYKTKDYSISSF